jgi:hypothetical protein
MCEVVDSADAVALAQKPNKLRQGFITLAETLLSSISDVFPECECTERALHMFLTVVKGNETFEDEFIRRCHVLFKQHAQGLKAHDAEALFTLMESLEQLRDIDLREKWEDPDFTAESRDHLWQYVAALKTYADLYTAVPKNVMGKIENVAGKIGEKLSRGELDLRNMDLGSIGQTLLADMSAEELEGFEGNLPDIYESLSEVAGTLGGGGTSIDVSKLMEQLASQTGELGPGAADALNGVDMTTVLQQLTSQMRPSAGARGAPAVDVGQLLRTMGPMMQAIQSAQPSARAAVSQGASQPAGQGGPRRVAGKRRPR